MEKTSEINFESQTFGKRLKSMLKVDFRRMFTMPLFYIMVGASLIMPILILVMTTAMPSTMVDPVTGIETTMETFTNTWQAIASISGESASMGMDLVSMCNINMLYFLVSILVCLFVADDFRSGYAKNLFTVRSRKTEYIISKSLIGFVGGACMFIGWFIGAILGGAISSLSFDPGSAGASGIVMCMISKIFLIAIFVSIFVLMSVVAKQRLWLSIVGSLGIGMLFFTMIPMVTPLNSTIINVILSLVGGGLFATGIGAISNIILKKTNIL